jgi:two-component system chemotaxis response regulator CheY
MAGGRLARFFPEKLEAAREEPMAKKVLIVDDSASMRQMIAFTLTRAGYDVSQGINGKDGLTQLAKHQPHLIISDLNMPEMDGLEFIRQLRTLPGSRLTPVLMLTTESDSAKKQAGKSAGATGWLVKPFQPEQLLQVILRVLP